MKYIVASIVSLCLIVGYAVIGASFDWRNGGGFLPQAILWMVICGVWLSIVRNWQSSAQMKRSPPDIGKSGARVRSRLDAALRRTTPNLYPAIVAAFSSTGSGTQSSQRDMSAFDSSEEMSATAKVMPLCPPDPDHEKHLFAKAFDEIERMTVDKGVWAQALTLSLGKEEETRARYIALRVADLKRTSPPPVPRPARVADTK